MRYYNNRGKSIYKGSLYRKIKNKAESDFVECYENNDMISLEDCIDDSIDYFWNEILENEDYEHIQDEDTLGDLLFNEINGDLDEDDIVDNLNSDEGYWGLSPMQRNYGLR